MAALPNRHEIAPVSGDKVSIVSLRFPSSARPLCCPISRDELTAESGFSSFSRRQLPGATEGYTQATFCILEEDHTLGNLLRWMLMKKYVAPLLSTASCPTLSADLYPCPCSPSVEFCGYRYATASRRRCGSDPDARSDPNDSAPHPSEAKIHIRVQMYGASRAAFLLGDPHE
jgi:hypothetical protein